MSLGVLALGLIDDTLGDRSSAATEDRSAPRGWRGHGGALLRGELSTGALKAAGSLGLALLAMSWLGLSNGRWLLAAAVLVLATNAFNLIDLRPGRAVKAFVLPGGWPGGWLGRSAPAVGAGPVRRAGARGWPVRPARAGDARRHGRQPAGRPGGSVAGARRCREPGSWSHSRCCVVVTVYGEIRSISALVERTPGLRQLDSLGRPA